MIASYPGLPMFFNIRARKIGEVWSIWWCNRTRFGTRLRTLAHAMGHEHGFATWLNAWASGRRYSTASATASDYITRSTWPSRFFSRTLKNMDREGLGTRLEELFFHLSMSKSENHQLSPAIINFWLISQINVHHNMVGFLVDGHIWCNNCTWKRSSEIHALSTVVNVILPKIYNNLGSQF